MIGHVFFFICFFCFVFYHNYMLFTLQKTSVQTYNNATPASGRHAAHQHVCVVCTCACVLMLFFFWTSVHLKHSLLYSHSWYLEVGLSVEAVRHLEGSGALHLPHTFQRYDIQLELSDEVETYCDKKKGTVCIKKKKKQKKKAQWEESDV